MRAVDQDGLPIRRGARDLLGADHAARTRAVFDHDRLAECLRRRRTRIAACQELDDAGAVCWRFGISRPTLRNCPWQYDADGDAGVMQLSRRPRQSPAQKVGESEAKVIVRSVSA